jgi:hypothetical protein
VVVVVEISDTKRLEMIPFHLIFEGEWEVNVKNGLPRAFVARRISIMRFHAQISFSKLMLRFRNEISYSELILRTHPQNSS